MAAKVFALTERDGTECKTTFFGESATDVLALVTRWLTAERVRYSVNYVTPCHATCMYECGI